MIALRDLFVPQRHATGLFSLTYPKIEQRDHAVMQSYDLTGAYWRECPVMVPINSRDWSSALVNASLLDYEAQPWYVTVREFIVYNMSISDKVIVANLYLSDETEATMFRLFGVGNHK